jgi:ABC-type glycerol-3-phosphate transport system substrate-binding protein
MRDVTKCLVAGRPVGYGSPRRLSPLEIGRQPTLLGKEEYMGSTWDRAYNRLQAMGVGAAGIGALYLAACGDSGSSGGRDVAVVFDFDYAGAPGSMKRYWEALQDRLAKSDVDARLSDVQMVNYANMQARLQSAHAARRGPTLETWYPDWFTWEFISQDALAPVEDYVGDGGTDDWLFTNKIDGKYWGSPFYAEQALLVANRKHLDKAGVEIPDRIESWDKFMEDCAAIKRTGEIPIMMGVADGFGADRWAQAISMEFMNSVKELGQSILGQLPTDEPVISAWMDRFNQLYKDRYVNDDVTKLTEQQSLERFLDGEGAFAILSPGAIFKEAPETYRVIGYWAGPGVYSAPAAVSGDVVLLTSYGENRDAAGRVVEFMQEPAQLALFNEITGELPCNKQFDPGNLGELARASWDLLNNPGDGKKTTWPRNYVPTVGVNVIFDLAPRAFSGESPDALRAEYDRRMAKYREQNSAEASELQKYLDSIED